MDKARLREAIVEKIQADLNTQIQAALTSRDEATHEESRPENQYDMHAQEAAYLAEGQARLVKELGEAVAAYRALSVSPWPEGAAIGVGALVKLQQGKQIAWYFVGPRNGGIEVESDDASVTVITPSSPIGRQLVGAKISQSILLPARPRSLEFRVEAVL